MAKEPTANGGHSVNITGDNNAVLVGVSAGDVSIRINAAAKSAISEALQAVLDSIDHADVRPETAAEVREVALECAKLVENANPNKLKLVASLKAIAETIRTVGAMNGAYQLVTVALGALGVAWPS